MRHLAMLSEFRGGAGPALVLRPGDCVVGAPSLRHALLEKLAVLVPRPRVNLLLYHVDTDEKIRAALPQIDGLIESAGSGGLVTLERLEVVSTRMAGRRRWLAAATR
jgi:PII-like signaling protein